MGAIRFELSNCSNRHVTMFYHNRSSLPSPPFEYVKVGPNPPGSPTDVVYMLSAGAPNNLTFGTASPYGVPVAIAEFDLADGQQGDDTGADNNIIDQGGPGFQQPTPTPALTSWGLVAALLIMLGVALLALRRRRGTE